MEHAKIEIENKVNVTVAGKPIDEFIDLVSVNAHELLCETSVLKEKYNLSEGSLDCIDGLMCEILDYLND